jgi:hypothetical protein
MEPHRTKALVPAAPNFRIIEGCEANALHNGALPVERIACRNIFVSDHYIRKLHNTVKSLGTSSMYMRINLKKVAQL